MKNFKINEEFEIKSTDNKIINMKNIIVLLSLFSVLSFFGFCYSNTKTIKKDTIEFLIIDTIDINKIDTFMLNAKCNPENVLVYMHKIGFSHPYESCAQMSFETNNFQSNLVKSKNNLGGYQTSQGYLYFNHWTDCIRFAKKWQLSHGLTKNKNFYEWLNTTNYHESDKKHYNSNTIKIEINLRKKYPLRWLILKYTEK